MDKGKTSRFFKAYRDNKDYKVFLDDVSVIYKLALKRTPPLKAYDECVKHIGEDTDESFAMQN